MTMRWTDEDPCPPAEMPEAPRDPSIDSAMVEPDGTLSRHDEDYVSDADWREAGRLRITIGALRDRQRKQREQWAREWRRSLEEAEKKPR